MSEAISPNTKKILAVAIGALLVVTIFIALFQGGVTGKGYETGEASLDMLIDSRSTRSGDRNASIVVSDACPFYALVGTPVACYYEGANSMLAPLLSADENSPSTAVKQFLNLYGAPPVTTIGPVGPLGASQVVSTYEGSIKDVSLDIAKQYWQKTDGAILVQTETGYETAVSVAVLGSYLNVPVIVTDEVDSTVAETLDALDVKYTLVCGQMNGYEKTLHFKTAESVGELNDLVTTILKDRIKSEVQYIAIANPLDAHTNEVLETTDYHFDGKIGDSASTGYAGAAPDAPDGPIHNFTIPENYPLANLKIDVRIDLREVADPDYSGERVYIYLGVDENDDGMLDTSESSEELHFFGGSPAYDYIRIKPEDPMSQPLYAHFYTELPYYNDVGPHHIQLIAKLPTDPDYQTTYTLDVEVDKLATPAYPLMPKLSSLASYLAAYRKGLVLAKPTYQLHDGGYMDRSSCGVPAANEDVLIDANEQTLDVKNDLNVRLGKLAGIEVNFDEWGFPLEDDVIALAEHYRSLFEDHKADPDAVDLVHVGIIADTNMIPQYYYPSTGQGSGTEGFGIPSDIIYQDIDADPDDPPYELGDGRDPDFELPIGRISGWDSQDASALIARTFFYYDIIDNHRARWNGDGVGQHPWKDSAMTTVGSVPPVGSAYAVTSKLDGLYKRVGFNPNPDPRMRYTARDNEWARRIYGDERMEMGYRGREFFKDDGAYNQYESSNFIMFCSHGFYYWYVPGSQEGTLGLVKPVYGGSAFDVAHVKDMTFGPSVVFGSSCVTGRIDGLQPYNTISQAFLHAGMACYVGATRSSWGALIPIPDEAEGEVLGDLLALYFYGNLLGYIYNKQGNVFEEQDLKDTSVGIALMDAKNKFVQREGSDGGGTNDDTFEEFIILGDPAFNPYEPNHEGAA